MSIARETAGRLADQIKDTVVGRGANYGPPEENFANIAAFWSAWLKARHRVDVPIDAHDVGQMSAMIKVARLAQTPSHEDSALDGAIYMMLGHGCAASDLQAALGRATATEPQPVRYEGPPVVFRDQGRLHRALFTADDDIHQPSDACVHGVPPEDYCAECVGHNG